MAERIQLKPHLTTEELLTRYRSCQKPQEKVRWHALYLIAKGEVAADAARRVGRASSWITNLARRYNREGVLAVSRK
jgi:transposase